MRSLSITAVLWIALLVCFCLPFYLCFLNDAFVLGHHFDESKKVCSILTEAQRTNSPYLRVQLAEFERQTFFIVQR